MLKFYIFFIGHFLISNVVCSQFKLDIEIANIKNNTGNLMLQLFDSGGKAISQNIGIIKDNKCSFSFVNLKPGKYAVRYYHDANLNGKMDKNLLGKPTEGYGFSNNVTDSTGAPPFEKWLFEISGDKKIILKPLY